MIHDASRDTFDCRRVQVTSPPLTRREYAYFKVAGPGTHETVTQALGMTPSECGNVGDPYPRTGRPRRFMAWYLRSGLDDTEELSAHIDSLLLALGPRAEALRSLWVDYTLTMQCVGYFPETGHGAHFDR